MEDINCPACGQKIGEWKQDCADWCDANLLSFDVEVLCPHCQAKLNVSGNSGINGGVSANLS